MPGSATIVTSRAPLVAGARHDVCQQHELALAADQGVVGAARRDLALADHVPERDRFRLSLRREGLALLRVEVIPDGDPRELADHDATGGRGRLHATRRVYDIAGDRLADLRAGAHRDHGLTGVHRHTDRVPALGSGQQLQRRSHRALGIVLVRDRGAEHAHRCVADELIEVPAEALDRRLRLLVERDEGATDVLGVGGVRALREPDEIDEQDRYRLALGGRPAVSGVPQVMQKRASAGFSAPQLGHVTTVGVYGVAANHHPSPSVLPGNGRSSR